MENFQHSTVYQIYPKSFQDSNGDGIGDLQGIIHRLGYIAKLGADFIWLTPFFKSPQKDNGYDVENYLEIDPVYGTMADFEELVRQAAKRGISIMLDMVFNHTSTRHPWFKKALAGDVKYKDYYIWKKGKENGLPPTNWESKFGGSAWEYLPQFKEYYLHLFDTTQADLNWENPDVRAEMREILRFWVQKGVKGFRFDVINLISKPDTFYDDNRGDGRRFYTDGPKVHQYIKELCAQINAENLMSVGEMSSTCMRECAQYSNPKAQELTMCFNFHHLKVDYKNQNKWQLQPPDFMSLKKLLNSWQLGMQQKGGWNALFWSNHDQPRVLSRFGNSGKYFTESAKMLAAVMYLAKGTPYIYQGEEIGMTNANFDDITQYKDVESLQYYTILRQKGMKKQDTLTILGQRSRDNARTPMQWDDTENAGFSSGVPWLRVNPNYTQLNVTASLQNHHSIFAWYKNIVQLRKEMDVIAKGSYQPLLPLHPQIFAYLRQYQKETVLVIANFFAKETIFELECPLPTAYRCLMANYNEQLLRPQLKLRPYETLVYYWK